MIADPPLFPGAVNDTVACPLPAVAVPIGGAPGGVAYVRAAGLVSEPLLLGVSVTGPTAVGVIVNVWEAAELMNVNTIGVDRPPPDGEIVIVPL